MNLPEWIEEKRHPDYAGQNCCVPCDQLPKMIEALSIAIEALEKIGKQSCTCGIDDQCAMEVVKEALARIEKMGGVDMDQQMTPPDRSNDSSREKAETIAISIIEEIRQYFDTYRLSTEEQTAYRLSAQKCIEHHLESFAREAVIEALADFSKDANIILETSVDAARKEALEEAAKVAEEMREPMVAWHICSLIDRTTGGQK